jgi:membrane protease YdiL (CAAX protease family)
VSAVAVAEEVLLRGALWEVAARRWGLPAALAVTTGAFGLLHVPLYGWDALPLDLAVGLLLGGLRLAAGGWGAPAVAHTLADLAGWWLR